RLVLLGLFALCLNGLVEASASPGPRALASATPSFHAGVKQLATLSATSQPVSVGSIQPASNSVTLAALSDSEILQGYPASGCGSQLEMRVGYDDTLTPDGQI